MSGHLVDQLRRHLEDTIGEAVERATGQAGLGRGSSPVSTVRARQPGGSAPGSAVPDDGRGRLNDPTTGTPYFVLDISQLDGPDLLA